MKNGLTTALLALSLLAAITSNTLAQSRTRQRHIPTAGERSLIFIETGIGVGIGKYNATGITTGLSGRFQMPLGSNFTLNASTGFRWALSKKRTDLVAITTIMVTITMITRAFRPPTFGFR